MNITTDLVLYADDTTLLARDRDALLHSKCQKMQEETKRWFHQHELHLNADKTEEMLFTTSRRDQQETSDKKFLGVRLDVVRPHIEGIPMRDSCRPVFKRQKILTLHATYIMQHLTQAKRDVHTHTRRNDIHAHATRQGNQLEIPFGRLCTTNFVREGLRLYNQLPEQWKNLTRANFKRQIQHFLQDTPIYSVEEFYEIIAAERRRLH